MKIPHKRKSPLSVSTRALHRRSVNEMIHVTEERHWTGNYSEMKMAIRSRATEILLASNLKDFNSDGLGDCTLGLEHASSLPDTQCLMLVHISPHTQNTVSAMTGGVARDSQVLKADFRG